jgi:hypothetical protein
VSAEALNLEAIQRAIVQHNGNCDAPLREIRMAPFEVERFGWDQFRGVPIRGDEKMPTGRFRLVCSGQHGENAPVDAISEKREVPA